MPDESSNLGRILGKTGPFGSTRQEVYLNLMRTHAIASGPFDRLMKSHGISQSLYNILRILNGHREQAIETGDPHHGVPVLRIGDQMVSREPDLTRLVNRLEKAGLAERKRCSADKRVVYVRITDRGIELLGTLIPLADALHESQFRGLSDADLKSLNELLFRAAVTVKDSG